MLRVRIQDHIEDRKRELWQEAIEITKVLGEAGNDLLKEAYRERLHNINTTIGEVIQYMSSPKGERWWFGLSIKPLQKGLTDTDIDEVYDKMTLQQMEQFRNFQYRVVNPEDAQSAVNAARNVESRLADIPEDLQEDIAVLCSTIKRDVTDYLV